MDKVQKEVTYINRLKVVFLFPGCPDRSCPDTRNTFCYRDN